VGTQIAVSQVQAGKVRALAVSSAKRSAVFPELPTIAEAGLTGYAAERQRAHNLDALGEFIFVDYLKNRRGRTGV